MYLRLAITTQQQLKAKIIPTRGLHIAIDCILCYSGSADDLGPMNFTSIHQFCSLVDEQASKQGSQHILLPWFGGTATSTKVTRETYFCTIILQYYFHYYHFSSLQNSSLITSITFQPDLGMSHLCPGQRLNGRT